MMMVPAYVSCSESSGFVTSRRALAQFNTNELTQMGAGDLNPAPAVPPILDSPVWSETATLLLTHLLTLGHVLTP